MNKTYETALRVLREMCAIPAPSHQEDARANYVRDFWQKLGAQNVYVDEAKNCVWEPDTEGDVTLFTAHTDTVFSDTTPMPMREENGRLYCPGCGDDTANLAVLMAVTGEMLREGAPVKGLLFAANSCEEGLGNLKGIRALMDRYGKRVKRMISFDCHLGMVTDVPVGSERYEISVQTQGGHSFADYGRPNAVHLLSRIVCELYDRPLPAGPGVATQNVGVFEGGSSVNAIAQSAAMKYEFRTNNADRMRALRDSMNEILRAHPEAQIRLLGERPCAANVDRAAQEALVTRCLDAVQAHMGVRPLPDSASTDCNIPLSMGVPACCVGLCNGDGMHTREEWVELASLQTGIRIAGELMRSLSA